MKPSCIFVLLLAGIAQGQTDFCAKDDLAAQQWLVDHHQAERIAVRNLDLDKFCLDKTSGYLGMRKAHSVEIANGATSISMGNCESLIYFHDKSKAIKDIFPEECPAKTVDQKVLDPTNPCGLGSPATEDKAKVAECMKQLLGEIHEPEPSGIEGLHGGGSDRGILVEPPKPPDDTSCMVQLAKGANLPVVIAEMTITLKSQNCIVGIDPEIGPVVIRFLDIERPGSFPDIERLLSPGGLYTGMFLIGATKSAPEQDPNPAVFYPVPPDVPAIQKPAEGITMPLWGCADKSRILLTAEDGKKWCHKVQP